MTQLIKAFVAVGGQVSDLIKPVLRTPDGGGSRRRSTCRSAGIIQSAFRSLGVHSVQEGESQ